MNKPSNLSFLLGIVMLLISCEKQQELPGPTQEINEFSIEFMVDQYVVVLHDRFLTFRKSEDFEAQQEAMRKEMASFFKRYRIEDDQLGHLYTEALMGFSARLDAGQLKQLEVDPWVKYVEPDQAILLRGPKWRETEPEVSTQTVPRGVTRVGGGQRYTGRNVAFVLDTGIDIDHPDLQVHPIFGFTAFQELKGNRPSNRQFYNDGHGHGTHVAGIIGAIDNSEGVLGVAAGVTLVPVKVMDDGGSGTMGGILAGVDYVGHRGKRGDVANMSIGTYPSKALDEAVINAANRKGIYFVAAAGNSGLHASALSPARITGQEYVKTVAAISDADIFAPWSHYGVPPVDYAAPGIGVLSTWRNGGYRHESGTSMAAPHLAGLLLLGDIGEDGFAIDPPDASQYPIAVHKTSLGRR